MQDLDIKATYKYTREEEKGTATTFVGYIVPGTLDGGDYGVSHTIDLNQPNGEILGSVPVSKLVKIDKEEYCDICGLNYGIEI